MCNFCGTSTKQNGKNNVIAEHFPHLPLVRYLTVQTKHTPSVEAVVRIQNKAMCESATVFTTYRCSTFLTQKKLHTSPLSYCFKNVDLNYFLLHLTAQYLITYDNERVKEYVSV